MTQQTKMLTPEQRTILNDALRYMKMAELKKACNLLTLPEHGKKMELITRITTFLTSGIILQQPPIPSQSKAQHHPPQTITPSSLMLYGKYKNDTRTRTFFKSLIGEQFHFTAFGIDWLQEQWQQGTPPTYQEFATYWQEETERRKHHPVPPKDEWMYINFAQATMKENPQLTKKELLQKWKTIQKEKAQLVFDIVQTLQA